MFRTSAPRRRTVRVHQRDPAARGQRLTQCFAPEVHEHPAADKHELGSYLLDGVDAGLPGEAGRDARGTEHELADGGFTNWTQKLLSDKKERLLISGMGTERIHALFR